MAQWGKELTIGKSTWVPLIDTNAFVPETSEDELVAIYTISSSGNTELEEAFGNLLLEKFTGRPYYFWTDYVKSLESKKPAAS